MTLIKTSLLNGIAVVIKMLTMLGLNKILAIYVGPAGYAVIGNFQNATQMIMSFASGSINAGVTKYTAEYYDDLEKQQMVWRTAGTIALFGSLLVAFLVLLFSSFLAVWFLKDASYASVFRWFSLTLIFFVFNALLLSILNGKKEIKSYVLANISGSLFSVFVSSLLTIKFGLYGALVSLAVYQSLSFFVTFFICRGFDWFKVEHFYGRVDKHIARNLFKYSVMIIVSVACGPTATLFVRNFLIDTSGFEEAGLWEAVNKLGGVYIMFFTSVLSVYLLPKLSELRDVKLIVSEIKSAWFLLIPVSIISATFVYLLRDFVILLLFSSDFLSARDFFLWQLSGEVLRLIAWILSFIILSKGLLKLHVICEVVFNGFFALLSFFMIGYFGTQGVPMAYTLVGGIYLATMLYIFFVSDQYSFYKNRKLYE